MRNHKTWYKQRFIVLYQSADPAFIFLIMPQGFHALQLWPTIELRRIRLSKNQITIEIVGWRFLSRHQQFNTGIR